MVPITGIIVHKLASTLFLVLALIHVFLYRKSLDLKFIFDTGASSICISSAEATVMVRQGQITRDDILGQQQFQDATGRVSVGTVINLKTVEIGGIVLHDVEATVVDNIQAPLLLGQTALAKFGKISIDYDNLTIEFN